MNRIPTMAALGAALLLAGAPALAKLPAPSDEAKAKAAETAAKAAHNGKVENYKLCLVMDRVASAYRAGAQGGGKALAEPVATPACSDPGVFAYAPPEVKPIEAAGAHSPAATAVSPPSTTTPAAAIPAKK